MIMAGRNLRQMDDGLVKVKVEYLYRSLRNPQAEIAARIRQLRIVRDMDTARYREQKSQLPYVVCGIFAPASRRKENFAYTEYFILDIDHISEKGLNLTDLRTRIQADPRVVLAFVSPSEDGLKVMFRLTERCHDAGLYSTFYRAFARSFSAQYGLEQVIDAKTSDVARACFVSIDPDAYYNPDAERVDLKSVVPTDSPTDALDLMALMNKLDAEEKSAQGGEPSTPEPDNATVDKIKAMLNLARQNRKPAQQVAVPKALDDMMEGLGAFMEANGVGIVSVRNISYAKQVRFLVAGKEAQVNIFYGKRGFRVVRQPVTDTDDEMNEMVGQMIEVYLEQNNL